MAPRQRRPDPLVEADRAGLERFSLAADRSSSANTANSGLAAIGSRRPAPLPPWMLEQHLFRIGWLERMPLHSAAIIPFRPIGAR